MYQISGKIIKFIENTMKNWRVELTAGGKSLAEVKIQGAIFQGDALSLLLFGIVMIPLNHILKKCTRGHKLHKSGKKINHLMYMNEIKLFVKKKKNGNPKKRIKDVIIIIIMSCRQHGYPWPSLATSPYRSSPLAGLQGYIPYSHRAAVCMSQLVVLLLLGHTWGSIGVL